MKRLFITLLFLSISAFAQQPPPNDDPIGRQRLPPEMVGPLIVVGVLFIAMLIAYPWIILTAGTRAYLEISERVLQASVAGTLYNGPGRRDRTGQRAPGIGRTERVMPRKLGHAVLGSPDYAITRTFFVDGLGVHSHDTALVEAILGVPAGMAPAQTPAKTEAGATGPPHREANPNP